MQHAVVVAHPNAASFNLAVANADCEAARARGHVAILRDLYRMGFDPRLQSEEIPRPEGFTPGDDVMAERAIIAESDVFVFVYPLWFNAPPAMLKGYIDRVFGMGFGYGPFGDHENIQLLKGRRMISFSSSGAPTDWLEQEGGWAALRNLFDDHVANVCGLTCLDHVHFGETVPMTRKDVMEARLASVAATVGRYF
jgi:NAD(P)H dehydrogenase (quinone)